MPQTVVALRDAAGNRAMARRIQRVVRDTQGGAIEPRRSSKAWNALTAAQRTRADRMANDPYRLYEFRGYDHFFAVLKGVEPDPGPKAEYWRKSGDPTTSGAPLGVQDPLIAHHTPEAGGGLLIEQGETPWGGPRHVFVPVGRHVSNWASFVEVHYDGARRKLENAGKYAGAAGGTLERLHAEAIEHADVMDSQEVEQNAQLQMSRKGFVWSGVAVQQKVNEMWRLVAAELGTSRAAYAKARLPRWGQLHGGGMGTSVQARFVRDLRQSIVAGSSAAKEQFKPPWLVELDRRIDGVTLKSTYVLGHLLNDNLGGPTAPYNIVPLTGDANQNHLHTVETYVKKKVLEMLDEMASEHSPMRNPITEVVYAVEAKYDGHPRRSYTNDWIRAYNFLVKVISGLTGVQNFKRTMSVQDFHNHLMLGTFAAHTIDGTPMDLDNAWKIRLKRFMDVVAYDRAGTTVAEALHRIDVISDVWIKEEQYVPTRLVCNSKTLRDTEEDGDGRMADVSIENRIDRFRLIEPVRE